MTKRQLALSIAFQYLGTPYLWGGDDPILGSGFDCSGFCIEVLKSVGVLPRKGDWTADSLSKMWPAVPIGGPADLVFWWNSGKTRVAHVEMVFGGGLSIGASGGGSATVSVKDSIKSNAFVKIRPVHSRSGLWGYVSPY